LGFALALAIGATGAHGGGSNPTVCSTFCTTLTPTLCTVSNTVHVVPGSNIDCGTRAVEVRGGHAQVHDGRFVLRGASVLVTDNGSIEADCPQGTTLHGVTLLASGAISIPDGGGGKVTARCDAGGGQITLDAGGAVTIGAQGIDAGGSATDADGGSISIATDSSLTTTAPLRATVTGGQAAGGTIALRADTISIDAEVTVAGTGSTDDREGGTITMDADGDITIETGGFVIDAGTSKGDGGSIELSSRSTIAVNRPLKARGIGSGTAGGSIELGAERIEVDHDLMASGDKHGGTIRLEARSDDVLLGLNTGSGFSLDASGASGGSGGAVSLESRGNDIDIRSSATLRATDGSGGGAGGSIDLASATVFLATGAQVVADGPSGAGGRIAVVARDTMTLHGTVRASNGTVDLVYRTGSPTIGSGVAAPYALRQQSALPAPCGDGVRRVGPEACDGSDLHDETCVARGFAGGGPLACSASCQFDTAGCVP
jgi:hypothetical protein